MSDKSVSLLTVPQCQRLHGIARERACAMGLDEEHIEACAFAFVESLLRQIERYPQAILAHLDSTPWLLRCADNWIKNYILTYWRQKAYDPVRQQAPPKTGGSQREFLAAISGLEQPSFLQEQMPHLDLALSQLTPEQRHLFHRHCIEGETFSQISATTHCSTESLRQSFCCLRRQLQTLLVQTGLGPREAMDCLYQTLTRHP